MSPYFRAPPSEPPENPQNPSGWILPRGRRLTCNKCVTILRCIFSSPNDCLEARCKPSPCLWSSVSISLAGPGGGFCFPRRTEPPPGAVAGATGPEPLTRHLPRAARIARQSGRAQPARGMTEKGQSDTSRAFRTSIAELSLPPARMGLLLCYHCDTICPTTPSL